jgi:hypothetical protein
MACFIYLQIDTQTCNGVVPHPFAPILVTHGIDRCAAIWTSRPEDFDDHELQRNKSESLKLKAVRDDLYPLCSTNNSKTVDISRVSLPLSRWKGAHLNHLSRIPALMAKNAVCCSQTQ